MSAGPGADVGRWLSQVLLRSKLFALELFSAALTD
jgi:hypothetical protein